jgi:HSP20 family protein
MAWREGGILMKTLVPAKGIASLRREMDQLFDRIWQQDAFGLTSAGEWSPETDFLETKEGFVAKLEVPGIDPKDITVSLHDGLLMIKGEKKQEIEEKNGHFYRMERTYGSFVRSIRIPAEIEESRVNATFKNGLLTIFLPKTADAKVANVPIKTMP